MDKLYAPWRDSYVQTHVKAHKDQQLEKSCIFCDVFSDKGTDEEKFVLYKDADIAIMLNLYPYNGGHLLVFAKDHVKELYELSSVVASRLMLAVSKSMHILKKELGADAFNFGANVGKDAGAGIPDHMHLHVVPRWRGDTGFLTTIGSVKQVSVDLETLYKKLQPHFTIKFIG